jgi:hypothetical protein
MQPILSTDAEAANLPPVIPQAIAASADNSTFAVELELVSILDGPAFHGSARSRAFLRFVVEEALAGRQGSLKERTIGVAVLGKRSDYDTGADSTVRVRANEVRKRLSAHYDTAASKAGIRIELPLGSYAPRFTPVGARPTAALEPASHPPPMALRQLAAPTLIAMFLALIVVRGGVESHDQFSHFWDQAMVGRTNIAVVVDSETGGSISPQMADAALPIENLAEMLHVPVHIVADGGVPVRGAFVVRLSLREKPTGHPLFRLGAASVFRESERNQSIWLWAENTEALRAAAQILTSRSAFPEID